MVSDWSTDDVADGVRLLAEIRTRSAAPGPLVAEACATVAAALDWNIRPAH